MQVNDLVRHPATQRYRMTQLWDWGHNCKIMRMTQEEVERCVYDAFNFDHEYTQEERDRFWEGYNAPQSRALTVSIKL